MTATILESVLLEYRLQKAALLVDVAAPPVRDASARAGEVPTADNYLFSARIGKSSGHWQYVANRVIVSITRVGFFDYPRRPKGRGRSDNAIELRSVLSFQVER